MSLGRFEDVEKDWTRFAKLGRPPRIALVGCGAAKLDYRAPARQLYTGELFKKALAYAELVADRVLVLSGRWGLVPLDYEMDPYEYRLRSADAKWWSHSVVNCYLGLSSRFCDGWEPQSEDPRHPRTSHRIPGELIILAGRDYVDPILANLHYHPHITVQLPLDGMEIGERLRFLKQSIAKEKQRVHADHLVRDPRRLTQQPHAGQGHSLERGVRDAQDRDAATGGRPRGLRSSG